MKSNTEKTVGISYVAQQHLKTVISEVYNISRLQENTYGHPLGNKGGHAPGISGDAQQ